MSKKKKDSTNEAKQHATKAASEAKQAATGLLTATGEALKSPTAKEVYKAVGWAALGATVTAVSGGLLKVPTGK